MSTVEGKCDANKCITDTNANKDEKRAICCASPFCNQTFHLQCIGFKGKKVKNLYFLCDSCSEFIKYSNASLEQKLVDIGEELKNISKVLNHRIEQIEENFQRKTEEITESVQTNKVICEERATEIENILGTFKSETNTKMNEFEKKLNNLIRTLDSVEEKSKNVCNTNSTVSPEPNAAKLETNKRSVYPSLKYQIRIRGIDEAPDSLSYIDRQKYEIEQVEKILNHMNKNNCKICDCFRLGKYNKNMHKPRSLLVTFASVWDRNIVIQSASSLSNYSSEIFITPALSPQDMEKEKQILKKRWELIQSGTDRKQIRIKNLQLLVDGKIVDTAND